jgi:di/tripeptidase
MGKSARHHAGADNGIGMASALAVLADDSVDMVRWKCC